jgi:hypothetical protein
MISNGGSFNGSSAYGTESLSIASVGPNRWPVPTWKFGLRQSDDRGCV